MQSLLEAMFYYRTEPISTIFTLCVIFAIASFFYLLIKLFNDEKIPTFLFVLIAICSIGFVSGLTFKEYTRKEVTNLESRKFELYQHDDKLEFISKDENLRNATLQIEEETDRALHVRYKDQTFIVDKSYLTERN